MLRVISHNQEFNFITQQLPKTKYVKDTLNVKDMIKILKQSGKCFKWKTKRNTKAIFEEIKFSVFSLFVYYGETDSQQVEFSQNGTHHSIMWYHIDVYIKLGQK